MALALCSLPASGGVLFSDLGPAGNAYNDGLAEALLGSANSSIPGTPSSFAELFTVSGAGDESVGQIDLAVSHNSGLNTFTAGIWTDVGGVPGSQISGAFWGLSTNIGFATCCSLITVPVSGVTLTGGLQYFMVLGPVSFTDNSDNAWFLNNQGLLGSVQYSSDGTTFLNNGVPSTLSAFDVIGTPEPASFALSATGLAALFAVRRRKTILLTR
jgi:hypothetical protein